MEQLVLAKNTYEKLYRMLDQVTPLDYDCGILCNRVCCQGGKDVGMYLFPGEEQQFSGTEDWLNWQRHKVKFYDFPPSWQGTVNFLICTGECPRAQRPLQCRFYPLAPHLLMDRSLLIIYDPIKVPYQCPLIANKMQLSPHFISAVYQAWRILLQDERIKDLVIWDSQKREKQLNIIPDILLAEDHGAQ